MSELGLGTPETRATTRHVRRRRGHSALATFAALAIVVGLLGAAVYFGRNLISGILPNGGPDDYPGPGSGSVTVQVSPGDSVTTIGETLVAAGVVATQDAFLEAAASNAEATGIQPGTYELRLEMSASGALAVLVDPANRLVDTVALPEGLRLDEALTRLATGAGVSIADLEAAAADPAGLGLPAYAGGKLEGFLFPATYEFEPDATAAEVLATTIARFGQAAAETSLETTAAALGLSPLQALTVASIIEAEASRPEDRPKVARVIYNRLADGMRLQMDSTVHYVVGDTGSVFTTDQDRQVDSPYNTYRVDGLPPGPIGSPGQDALVAALSPAEGDWRYFVTVNLETGDTRFARTAEEHQQNVVVLQQYCEQSDLC